MAVSAVAAEYATAAAAIRRCLKYGTELTSNEKQDILRLLQFAVNGDDNLNGFANITESDALDGRGGLYGS